MAHLASSGFLPTKDNWASPFDVTFKKVSLGIRDGVLCLYISTMTAQSRCTVGEIINNSLAVCTFNKFDRWKLIMETSWNKSTLSEIFSVNSYLCCRTLHLTVTRPDGYRRLLHVRVIGIIAYLLSFCPGHFVRQLVIPGVRVMVEF